MAGTPLQSVIIPTFNRRDMLAEAISSVLNQSQASLEVIVVDDCSTDGTEEYVRSIPDERVRYFRNERNSGQDFSRMVGFRQARGKYITFIDDDDYYTDYGFYAKATGILDEHECDDVPVVMVCANARVLTVSTGQTHDSDIGRPGRVRGVDYILRPGEYRKPPSVFPTVFRADALRRAGLEDMLIFDTMTYIQAALEGDAWFIPDVIGIYRIHGVNHSLGLKNHKADRARHYSIVREGIKRWRLVRGKLLTVKGRMRADLWYVSAMSSLLSFYAVARPGVKDRLHTLGVILRESGFMPSLWLLLPLHMMRGLLRKLYRSKIWRALHS